MVTFYCCSFIFIISNAILTAKGCDDILRTAQYFSFEIVEDESSSDISETSGNGSVMSDDDDDEDGGFAANASVCA